MESRKQYWNNKIRRIDASKAIYDGWLDKHVEAHELKQTIVELGCGWGCDTQFLARTEHNIISCDFSIEAIEIIRERYPNVMTMQFDMLDGLPFDDERVDIIVADLCLHYFDWKNTVLIFNELLRVLIPGGKLLFRVNSSKDTNFGAGEGTVIEDNYYMSERGQKRFFTEENLIELLENWHVESLSELTIGKYGRPKVVFEAVAIKR
ncbi:MULTISPECIES: class I SAM-dependent methyltransferase [unclassified Fusibacter]|uniref:class I SAM-dependent methyltransferase n=1 Tax=unclassified Fusibacter TaxID=2624464 RepID=UPI0010108282|nr:MULTISPECIES: class I SAM-dependent methyltransferase [unclassified Fusibacter]MCK8058515.1 class I SAM-dependent methyltransferase [Fusibacter sp. A2]NPE22716.1 class I SAM-dependent methyltransferase [Fusibacter sp. A1]RXV60276.1 class I SAM-dependent methyltransferase [Fusibacter sp. A1]